MAIENTYCKIGDNGEVLEYPYSFVKMREDNPNKSFPSKILRSDAINFGAAPVIEGEKPSFDKKTQRISINGMPTFNGTDYVLEYTIIDLTEEERTSLRASLEVKMRALRDRLLAESDFVVVKNMEQGTPVPEAWKEYRQSLRDMPEDENWPWEAGYKTKPSE